MASRALFETAVANHCIIGRSRDGLYEPVLADIEREAVADLLQYLENVRLPDSPRPWLSKGWADSLR